MLQFYTVVILGKLDSHIFVEKLGKVRHRKVFHGCKVTEGKVFRIMLINIIDDTGKTLHVFLLLLQGFRGIGLKVLQKLGNQIVAE